MDLVFTKRNPDNKYQVRFWSRKTRWTEFMDRCAQDGLVAQDVMNEFLEWFISRPATRATESEGGSK